MPGLSTALPAGFDLKARERFIAARGFALRACRVTGKASLRFLQVSGRVLRRGLNAVLGVLEAVLLSASGRERIHAITTFALIFLFAVTSVDFLISGGPEFGAPARSERPAAVVQAAPSAAPEPAAERADADVVPTEVASSLAETRAASVVAVSQSFEPPLARRTAVEPSESAAAAGDAPLVGEQAAEPTAPAAPDVTRERKRKLTGR